MKLSLFMNRNYRLFKQCKLFEVKYPVNELIININEVDK